MSGMGKFVHLHVHSEHTVGDSVIRVPQLCERIRDLGMTAVAVTDLMTVSGVGELLDEAARCGIAPILGAELLVDHEMYPIVTLCESREGARNLFLLLDDVATRRGRFVTKKELANYADGLIGIAGGLYGEIWDAWGEGGEDDAVRCIKMLRDIFARDRFFLELCDTGPGQTDERQWNEELLRLARITKTDPVVTGDCRVLEMSQLGGLGNAGTKLGLHLEDALQRYVTTGKGKYLLRAPQDYIVRLGRISLDAVRNTVAIAGRCRVALGVDARRWLSVNSHLRTGERDTRISHADDFAEEKWTDGPGNGK